MSLKENAIYLKQEQLYVCLRIIKEFVTSDL